jgi:multiple sugar transport system substrate-binding protein
MTMTPSNLISAFADATGANLALLRMPGDAEFGYVGSAIDPPQWFSISANSQYPHAAARLVNFLVNDLQSGAIMGTDRGVPLNPEVAEYIYEAQDAPGKEMFGLISRIQANSGRFVPLPPGGGEQEAITVRTSDSVLFGTSDAATAARQWLADFQQALDDAR